MSEEPQGHTLRSNPMEGNGFILEWRAESNHKGVDNPFFFGGGGRKKKIPIEIVYKET